MQVMLLTIVFFALCMAGLGLGTIVAGRRLKGSCGADVVDSDGEVIACGACTKKEVDLCPTDNQLVALAQIGYPTLRHDHERGV